METKTLIELYKRVLVLFKLNHSQFICNNIDLLDISKEDKRTLKEHFFTQIPSETQYTEIYNEPTFNRNVTSKDIEYTNIWFHHINGLDTRVATKKHFELRIKLLEAIINNLGKACV